LDITKLIFSSYAVTVISTFSFFIVSFSMMKYNILNLDVCLLTSSQLWKVLWLLIFHVNRVELVNSKIV